MSSRPLRLIHGSDFHLELPLSAFADAGQHLRDEVLDAPLKAARGVFDAALSHSVDFVVLSGGIVNPQTASPRAMRFLLDQFERLRARNMPVYWAGGAHDTPEHWPPVVHLPENVHFFRQGRPETIFFKRDGKSLASVVGASGGGTVRGAHYQADRGGLPTVVVAHGEAKAEDLQPRKIHYWALGGRQAAKTLFSQEQAAHFAGSPQGRTMSSAGKHGAALVQIDGDGRVQVQQLATDAIRWHAEKITADATAGPQRLREQILQRIETLAAASAERHTFVSWHIACDEPLSGQLRRDGWAEQLAEQLRRDYGSRAPAVWTVSLTLNTPLRQADELYEEDTILGDFLRSLRTFQKNADRRLNLRALAGERAQRLGELVRLDDAHERDELLREVAAQGVDLLAGPAAGGGAPKVKLRGPGGAITVKRIETKQAAPSANESAVAIPPDKEHDA